MRQFSSFYLSYFDRVQNSPVKFELNLPIACEKLCVTSKRQEN